MAAALRPDTALVLVEVVSNPTLRVADMEAISAACREKGVLLAVDNTFTTPLSGDAEDRLVHMKVLDVRYEDPVGDPLNLLPHYTVRSVLAY